MEFCVADGVFVRGLNSDEWEALLAVRLEAVTDYPNYFLSTPQQTLGLPKEEWQRRIDSDRSRIFGLFDGDALIGITGIYRSEDKPETAVMVMSYIKPAYRGHGYSKLFYKARIEWALQQDGLIRLEIGHRIGNDPSRHAMIAQGFQFTGTDEIDWPDGTRDTEYLYELDLASLKN